MTAIDRDLGRETLLSPSRVADYIQRLETKLGQTLERASILPGGGIEVTMSVAKAESDPAGLVDMSE